LGDAKRFTLADPNVAGTLARHQFLDYEEGFQLISSAPDLEDSGLHSAAKLSASKKFTTMPGSSVLWIMT
jgi:hypothetical protein